MKPENKFAVAEIYALAFGLFLGLVFWKFGNPVILDHKIIPPSTFSDFWNDAWPPHWANWIFLPLALVGVLVIFKKIPAGRRQRWLWLLPLLWFGWQLISATQTVDADLTATTLWQFSAASRAIFSARWF
jgi:hypothetical protein